MQLTASDWVVVLAYGFTVLAVGLYFARRAGRGTDEFFLAGRKLPWWLLGTSMVATTFSTDTPNLVTDMVRSGGVSQNWLWWAFVITGMCTVFFYARLWRRSGALTDMGVFFNVMIMATVTLAAIKIGGVLLGAGKYEVVLLAGAVTVLYSATSGLWGVVVTDLLLFVMAMVGSVAAAYYALIQPEVGGLTGLITNPELQDKLSFLPDFTDWRTAAGVFIVPVAVQWWSTWYPGAEPGGGGYVAQRMLAARNEKEAMGATLWFNVAHYALRPWPWVLVGLASLLVYPSLESIQAAFPHIDPSIVRNDLAYPAMLVFLPHGLLGLVVASLAAAYMSTISTHLNWGASYVVDDFYRRFVEGEKEDRHYVTVGRVTTVGLIVLAGVVSLWLENALQAFQILLQIGAGTGLVFLLRWFWWRVNAWSEVAAMLISFLVALYFQFVHLAVGLPPLDPSLQLVIGVALTTVGWLTVTFLTSPAPEETLRRYYAEIRPFGSGWRRVLRLTPQDPGPEAGGVAAGFLGWFLGLAAVYGALFGTGFILYGSLGMGAVCLAVAGLAMAGIFGVLPKVGI
jgi:Na+/proline symporter